MLKGFVGLGLAAVSAAFDFRNGYDFFYKNHNVYYFWSNLAFLGKKQ
jgi:hypothetical protein